MRTAHSAACKLIRKKSRKGLSVASPERPSRTRPEIDRRPAALLSRKTSGGKNPIVGVLLEERIEELRQNREHGGNWMARRAIEALVETAREDAANSEELQDALTAAGRRLAQSRPSVAAIAGAVGRLLAPVAAWVELEPAEFRRRFEQEAQALLDARDRAPAAIAIQLRDRLQEAFVLTHSASATVKEALLHCPPERVLCTVSRPFEEGVGLAEELREHGLAVELIEDIDASERLHEASLLLVGADTVFLDGTLLNKIGTRRLAEAAASQGIPVVVACEVIKVAPSDPETAPEDETTDLTPPDLIAFFMTEEGPYQPEDIRALVDRTPFLGDGRALLHGPRL
jgi:ribose 1,5-bisphosphate isomerase